jgi:aminodeoxyfutalosine deaminase
MRKISADYIFPISQPPIYKGIILLNNENIVIDVIDPYKINYEIQDVERYCGFICSGFINTHCHLELSYLKDKIQKEKGLHEFILAIEQLKNEDSNIIEEALFLADTEMLNNGIKAVGDISNNNYSFLTKKNSQIVYHTFIEVFGSHPKNAALIFNNALKLAKEYFNDKAISIVPHSPYSVSKELFDKIKTHALENNSLLCMHNQENEDENVYFRSKEGMIEKRMQVFGIENNSFKSTGSNSLPSVAEYLPSENTILLVHNTVSNADDIAFAVDYFKNPWWCFCPNSNLFIENILPDFQIFLKNNNNITIGTDSLASNTSLSILEELKTIHFNMPSIELNTLLKWGTFNGAAFLNLGKYLGSIEKGKNPGINLIENVDLLNIKLLKKSSVKVLV